MANPAPSTVTTCTITMRLDGENRERARQLLHSAGGPIQAKRGCLSCRVESDETDPAVLRYVEEWEAEEPFRRHVRSPEFWPVLVAMDLCSEEPRVVVGELSAQYGIETLRRIRGEPPHNGAV